MLKGQWTKYSLVGLVAAGTTWGSMQLLPAKEPRGPLSSAVVQEKAEMHNGQVQKLLKNHHDDVDGLLLEDGFEVHFPPHIGRKVAELIEPGDQVEVQGKKETRPRGEIVFEASQIFSHGKTIVVDRPRPPRGPKGPGRAEPPMNATGIVKTLVTNGHGDVDGFVLKDQTEVKFPPHLGQALQDLIKVGDEVQIDGRRHETPHGEIHLHADRIVAVATGKSLDRHESDGREPGRPSVDSKRDERDVQPTNADLLRELTAIRQLLEKRQP